MDFNLESSLHVLNRTPHILEVWLRDLPDEWILCNEGNETWSAYDVVGHLIHGEKTDWMERTRIIMSDAPVRMFAKFDRFAQFQESAGKTMNDLLDEFKIARQNNLAYIRSFEIDEAVLNKTGTHPSFGTVTLKQLLSTWVVHDLNHISQIARVMAKQYKEETGPWIEYLRILK
jgi:hypothetical protein